MSEYDQNKLEHMDAVRGLIEDGKYTVSSREEHTLLEEIRDEYEEFREENNFDESEAALHFMASAGMIAQSHLDWEPDRDRFFRTVRNALGTKKNRAGMLLERISTGDWWYEGVSETDLRNAYENLEASPENIR